MVEFHSPASDIYSPDSVRHRETLENGNCVRDSIARIEYNSRCSTRRIPEETRRMSMPNALLPIEALTVTIQLGQKYTEQVR